MFEVGIVRTVVGWVNVYLVGTDQRINLSPEEFAGHFPHFSNRRESSDGSIIIGICKSARDEITVGQARSLGFNVEVSEAVAV
jgi:hypothetical protein